MPIGQAMMFMCLMVGEILFGIALLVYVARCFQVVVDETAAGIDEVRWPDEPLLDWLARAAHLFWLIAVWLVPVGFLLRFLVRYHPETPPALVVLAPVSIFWLFFPIGVLSSMSGTSRWLVLRPKLLLGMIRVFPSVVVFYFVSALLVSASAVATYYALEGASMPLLAVAALAISTTLLIYARLLGRVAYLLNKLEPAGRQGPPAAMVRPPVRPVEVSDPWAPPKRERKRRRKKQKPVTDVAASPQAEAYGFGPEQPPPRPKLAIEGDYLPDRNAQANAEEEDDVPRDSGSKAAAPAKRRTLIREEPDPPPRLPLLSGVYTFPWYPNCLPAWIFVAGVLVAMGYLLQILLSLWSGLQ
jgi:hypothetical protein